MRIAYLLADPGIGVFDVKGASVHVQEMVRAMRAAGHQVTVYCVRRGDKKGRESVPADLADLEVVVETVDGPGLSADPRDREERLHIAAQRLSDRALTTHHQEPFGLIYERYALFSEAGARLSKALRDDELPADAAAGHSDDNLGAPTVPLVVEVNAPLVDEQRAHRSLHDVTTALATTARTLGAADLLSCVSAPVADWVRRTVPEAAERARVVPNGVNTERIRPAATVRKRDELVIGFVGTIKPWHGTETLLHAAARGPAHWQVEISGDGPARNELEELTAELGIEDRVTFHGAVNPESIPKMLHRLDVAVAPYPAPQNPGDHYFSPLKVYEYLAAGLAVVASGVGELPALLGKGTRGLTVAPGDPEALHETLLRLDDDAALRTRLGRAARDAAQTEHSWHARLTELLTTLEVTPA